MTIKRIELMWGSAPSDPTAAGSVAPRAPGPAMRLGGSCLMPFALAAVLFTGAVPPAGAATISAEPAATSGDGLLLAAEEQSDALYTQARDLIEQGRFDLAIDRLNVLIADRTGRTDAALYWRAYSLAKIGERADALSTLGDLQKQFAKSRWIRDARALEVELRQASGQTVSPDAQADQELKLMALHGLMQSNADRALPILEQMLATANSTKVKDRALFVLSQSGSARSREILANIAKDGSNPDLQRRAVRYLGMMGGPDNRQILADVYQSSSDTAVKRAIIRSYMVAGDRARILSLAKTETVPALRREAVQQLGVLGAQAELAELYQTETSIEVKKQILQAMFVGGGADKLIELAKTETDPQLRRTAIRNLGLMGDSRTSEVIKAIYLSNTAPEARKEAINALFLQSNAAMLVELARAEKDPLMKKEIVSKLALMQSKEATDYLLELLK
jgi:hypothetical protein